MITDDRALGGCLGSMSPQYTKMSASAIENRLANLSTKMWGDSERWKNLMEPPSSPGPSNGTDEWIGTWERSSNQKNWTNYLLFWGLEETEIEAEKGASQVATPSFLSLTPRGIPKRCEGENSE